MQNRPIPSLPGSKQQGRGLWSKIPTTITKAPVKESGRGNPTDVGIINNPYIVICRVYGEVNKTLRVNVSRMLPFVEE